METMIDELLAMARADTIVEDPEAVRLERVVRNSWEMTDLDGATLEVTAPETASVHCDPELLRHVFENLFRNAADHNEWPVSITVGTLDGDRSGFYVEDDGGGIPPGEREDVFEHGYSRAESGTGFGLSIVHTLARAHDWEVTVTDGTEGGARFEFVT
jgi:signal transduction histidine kinase